MKGSILDKDKKPQTNLFDIFNSIENKQEQYNWLITDIQCGIFYNQKYGPVFNIRENGMEYGKEYVWISGEELTKIHKEENYVWIWGVFSGFNKNILKEDVLKYDFPYADGYDGFWQNPLSIQHPLAEIEIVAWDSSLTLVISKNDEIVDTFMKNKPYAKDLEKYNNE